MIFAAGLPTSSRGVSHVYRWPTPTVIPSLSRNPTSPTHAGWQGRVLRLRSGWRRWTCRTGWRG